MKRILGILLLVYFSMSLSLVLAGRNDASGDAGDKTRMRGTADKTEAVEEAVQLAVDVAFSGESGATITDENGTCYTAYGQAWYEDKVYIPQYWGVFPLYFFGDQVGVTVTVHNESVSRKAKLKLRADCFVLKADGSNGEALMTGAEYQTTLLAGETKVIDASFNPDGTPTTESGLDRFLIKAFQVEETDDGNGEHQLAGAININPNNSDDNEFLMFTPDILFPMMITADDLRTPGFEGYSGLADIVVTKPKGNGNQNTFFVDGEVYPLSNANTYTFLAPELMVEIYNDKWTDSGEPIGQWWIAMNAQDATIYCEEDVPTVPEPEPVPLLVKEAIFCPPEFEGAFWQAVQDARGQ